jgi:hypothetical protein
MLSFQEGNYLRTWLFESDPILREAVINDNASRFF